MKSTKYTAGECLVLNDGEMKRSNKHKERETPDSLLSVQTIGRDGGCS